MAKYLTFDGPSGAGKGTLIDRLVQLLRQRGTIQVVVMEDRQFAPDLRDSGAKMLAWCRQRGISPSQFLMPLFGAGDLMAEKIIADHASCKLILRDRSFITRLAYGTAGSEYSQEDIWDLWVNHLGVRIPDLAVIVDADVSTAMERETKRTEHRDIGLGGKMSGDAASRIRIRDEFLRIPALFRSRLNTLVVRNDGQFTKDRNTIQERLDISCADILNNIPD